MRNPVKSSYYHKNLADWAVFSGIEPVQPSVFPVKSVTAMRACVHALEKGKFMLFATALFEADWRYDKDISLDDEIAACAKTGGLAPDTLLIAAKSAEAKQALTTNSKELIDRGGCGSPTFFVNARDMYFMYFGQDRPELIEAVLNRAQGPT
jgi:2-hydroxychromene-2-carboxylate isomerase